MQDLNFDLLKEAPTELMTEIKSDNIKLDDMTGNTGMIPESLLTPSGAGTNPTGFNPLNPNSSPDSQTLNAGNLITPELAIAFVDIIVPVVFVLLFKRIHDKTISKKDISLSSSEKETLKPVLQKYLNSINFAIENPLNALIVTMGFIYGMKYIEISNQLPSGTFKSSAPPQNIGEVTALGTIKRDGRGRPKGTYKKPKQVI